MQGCYTELSPAVKLHSVVDCETKTPHIYTYMHIGGQGVFL